ncbi:hypothetical protein C8R43DRAFT_1120224 [Mycena crocata]|nr:hypothetical protein C8R43DRAFT_1120224 [Mycena crocata]
MSHRAKAKGKSTSRRKAVPPAVQVYLDTEAVEEMHAEESELTELDDEMSTFINDKDDDQSPSEQSHTQPSENHQERSDEEPAAPAEGDNGDDSDFPTVLLPPRTPKRGKKPRAIKSRSVVDSSGDEANGALDADDSTLPPALTTRRKRANSESPGHNVDADVAPTTKRAKAAGVEQRQGKTLTSDSEIEVYDNNPVDTTPSRRKNEAVKGSRTKTNLASGPSSPVKASRNGSPSKTARKKGKAKQRSDDEEEDVVGSVVDRLLPLLQQSINTSVAALEDRLAAKMPPAPPPGLVSPTAAAPAAVKSATPVASPLHPSPMPRTPRQSEQNAPVMHVATPFTSLSQDPGPASPSPAPKKSSLQSGPQTLNGILPKVADVPQAPAPNAAPKRVRPGTVTEPAAPLSSEGMPSDEHPAEPISAGMFPPGGDDAMSVDTNQPASTSDGNDFQLLVKNDAEPILTGMFPPAEEAKSADGGKPSAGAAPEGNPNDGNTLASLGTGEPILTGMFPSAEEAEAADEEKPTPAVAANDRPLGDKCLDDLEDYKNRFDPTAKCGVFDLALQDPALVPMYAGLPPLPGGRFVYASYVAPNAPPVEEGHLKFSGWPNTIQDITEVTMRTAITFTQLGVYLNPSKASPALVVIRPTSPGSTNLRINIGAKVAICVSVGMLIESYLTDATSGGGNRLRKYIALLLHNQCWERWEAFMCLVFAEEYMFTPMTRLAIHMGSVLNPPPKNDSAANRKALSDSVDANMHSPVKGTPERPRPTGASGSNAWQSDPSRMKFSYLHTETIPVYDATKRDFNFTTDIDKVSQLPRWVGEIPVASFVMAAYTATNYKGIATGQQGKAPHVGCNLLWAVVCGIPKKKKT